MRRTFKGRPILHVLSIVCCVYLAGGCADVGQTDVHMTVNAGVLASAEGEHYELFATVNGSAVSIKRFVVRNEPSSAGLAVRSVIDFDPPFAELGVSDSLDANGLLQGGVYFRTGVYLGTASEAFATIERDDDVDPTPSTDVVFRGALKAISRGVLTAVLIDSSVSSVRQTNNELGTLAIVLPGDTIRGL